MAKQMTLQEKLEATFVSDTPIGFEWAREYASKVPGVPMEHADLDLRDWGFYYGVAYGIARGEDPYEPNGSAAKRAFDAALEVFAAHAEPASAS
jgi:hypothetical protein